MITSSTSETEIVTDFPGNRKQLLLQHAVLLRLLLSSAGYYRGVGWRSGHEKKGEEMVKADVGEVANACV